RDWSSDVCSSDLDSDVADVVVATGVHAAGNVQVQIADVEQVVQVIEAALDGLGDRDRLGVGQRAEVAAGAADDVGQQADVRRGDAQLAQFVPELEQTRLLDVGKDHVLLVGVAHLAEAVAIGEVGDHVQLFVGDVAGRNAGAFQR